MSYSLEVSIPGLLEVLIQVLLEVPVSEPLEVSVWGLLEMPVSALLRLPPTFQKFLFRNFLHAGAFPQKCWIPYLSCPKQTDQTQKFPKYHVYCDF